MDNLEYKIYRHELYPIENPNSTVVGFLITDNETNKTAVLETNVSIAECNGKTPEEVCQIAFEQLKDKIERIKQDFQKNRESVIGKVFLPLS
jgi:hypothetical protein